MKLKFEANQDYQLQAIESVTSLLEGQSHVEVEINFVEGTLLPAAPNRIDLDDESLLKKPTIGTSTE